jgi:hypothetical protein
MSSTVPTRLILAHTARLNSRERGSKLLAGRLHGHRHRDREPPITRQNVPRTEQRQANNSASTRRVADDVPLWRLLTLTGLRLTHVQVKHIVRGVIVRVVEAQPTDIDAHVLHISEAIETAKWQPCHYPPKRL